MFRPNYVINNVLLLLPIIVFVLYPELIGNNIDLAPFVAIPYIIVLIYFAGGDCPRCGINSAKHPKGFLGPMAARCRFCGKSFICDKFDREFNGVKNNQNKINYRAFIKEGANFSVKFILLMIILLFIKSIM